MLFLLLNGRVHDHPDHIFNEKKDDYQKSHYHKYNYMNYTFEKIRDGSERSFGKQFKVNLYCITREKYELCNYGEGVIYHPYIKIVLPAINNITV